MPNHPLAVDSESIEQILQTRDSYTATRLFETYRLSSDQAAFVCALIARLLLEIDRHETGCDQTPAVSRENGEMT